MKSKEMKHVPKLRFPEFLNDGEWEEKPLKKLAKNLDNKRIPITSSNRSQGDIPYYGASGIVDFVNDYIFDEELLCISEDGANLVARTYPIAFSISEKAWVNNHAHVLKFQNKYTQIIVENYLNSIKLDDFLTGMAQPKLNKAMLDIIPIPISSSADEQQKIADCLSSIDNLITASTKKVEALKEHKKGLMQQLFPSEGEKMPKLRFPEFLDEPEWEEKTLSKVGEIITGNTPPTAKLENYGGSELFVSPADISDKRYITTTKTTLSKQGFKQTRQVKANSILVVCIGSTIGKVAQNKFDCATNQQINSIVPFDEYSNDFVYSALENSSSRIASLAGNHAVPIINKSSFSSVLILCPLFPEQQKIAECLSSIDELITSSTKKVETLKEHKKGLMQQLFPSNDEVRK
jgi:type I restriction enzyme, S subunit